MVYVVRLSSPSIPSLRMYDVRGGCEERGVWWSAIGYKTGLHLLYCQAVESFYLVPTTLSNVIAHFLKWP
jgi:hypothetical protein